MLRCPTPLGLLVAACLTLCAAPATASAVTSAGTLTIDQPHIQLVATSGVPDGAGVLGGLTGSLTGGMPRENVYLSFEATPGAAQGHQYALAHVRLDDNGAGTFKKEIGGDGTGIGNLVYVKARGSDWNNPIAEVALPVEPRVRPTLVVDGGCVPMVEGDTAGAITTFTVRVTGGAPQGWSDVRAHLNATEAAANDYATFVAIEQGRLDDDGARTFSNVQGWGRMTPLGIDSVYVSLSYNLRVPDVGVTVPICGRGAISAPRAITWPAISGSVQVGQPLTALPGTWTDSPTSYLYQWRRCTTAESTSCAPIAGADQAQYTATSDDLGHRLRLRVTGVNSRGPGQSVNTGATGVLGVPVAGAAPTISGTAKAGHQLTGNSGPWTPTPDTVAYQWLRCTSTTVSSCTPITGADTQQYTTTADDVAHPVRLRATATTAHGTSLPSISNAVMIAGLPTVSEAPTITGSPQIGQQLTAGTGTWKGRPTSYSYAWLRCTTGSIFSCTAIVGETTAQYTPGTDDLGHTLRVRVTAHNANGAGAPSTSGATIAIGVPQPITGPTVSGTPVTGNTLTANPGTWDPNPTHYTYEWRRCTTTNSDSCTAIPDTNSSTYIPTSADVGQRLRVRVVAHIDSLTSAARHSGATAIVTSAT
jgi:hypothetical protein